MAQILDIRGNPISSKPVEDEIATYSKDIFQNFIGETLINPDKVLELESSGLGIELYEELMVKDTQVASTFQTRKLAVIGREWDVLPASDKRADKRIADYVKMVLEHFNYDQARGDLLTGIVVGFKASEIIWEASEGDVWIDRMVPKASRRFTFDINNKLRLLTISNMTIGEELPERKFQTFTRPHPNGTPFGEGLGKILYWSYWFKKNALKFWMIFADKFGSPTIVGKYPPGTSQKIQQDLYTAIKAIQTETAVRIPDNVTIDLVEAQRQGSINTYQDLCTYFDGAISKVILGHTGSADSTPGKLGQEHEAMDIRKDYIKADADLLCEAQNEQMIKWIVDYNYPGVQHYPKVWISTEDEKDFKTMAETDRVLIKDIGMRITEAEMYDRYGRKEPKEDEAVVVPPKAPSPFGAQPGEELPLIEGTVEQFGEGISKKALMSSQDEIDGLIDTTTEQAQLDLAPIYKIVEESRTYDEFERKLKKAFGHLDMRQFKEISEQAMLIAELQGMSNVEQTDDINFQDTEREQIFKRDKHTCRDCGEQHHAQNLQLHHFRKSIDGGVPTKENKIITLCLSCHRARHKRGEYNAS